MGKAHGKKRRLRKKFNYVVDRKKLWKKSKKMPGIDCPLIKEAWSEGKSVATNMRMMGLAADSNAVLKVPSTKDVIMKKNLNTKGLRKQPKAYVAEALEEEASIPYVGKGQLPPEHIHFASYMLETHQDDYKAMARDPRNHFQQTPKQIRRKVEEYKKYLERCNQSDDDKMSS